MLETVNLKLVLEFHTGNDSNGDAIISKVTISNLRQNLTAAELTTVGQVFASLVDYPLIDALAIATNRIYGD